MGPEVFVDILRDALFLVIVLVSAVIVPSLLVGLVVAVFQAATSINEQTLSFSAALNCDLTCFDYGRTLVGAKTNGLRHSTDW